VAGGAIVGLASSYLVIDKPWIQRLAQTLAFGHEALPSVVGFALFCGIGYFIYRTALKVQSD
jgi:hypothetical protein